MRSIFYYESLKSGFFNPYPDLLKGTRPQWGGFLGFQIFVNGTLKPNLDCVNPNPDSLKGTHL